MCTCPHALAHVQNQIILTSVSGIVYCIYQCPDMAHTQQFRIDSSQCVTWKCVIGKVLNVKPGYQILLSITHCFNSFWKATILLHAILLQQLTRTCSTKKKWFSLFYFPGFISFSLFFFSCSSVIHWMGHGFQCLTYANRHGQLSSDFQVKEFVVMDACLWLPVCTDLLRIITSCHAKHTDTL